MDWKNTNQWNAVYTYFARATCNLSTHSKISCDLLHNEDTTPEILNSMQHCYDRKKEWQMCFNVLLILLLNHLINWLSGLKILRQ